MLSYFAFLTLPILALYKTNIDTIATWVSLSFCLWTTKSVYSEKNRHSILEISSWWILLRVLTAFFFISIINTLGYSWWTYTLCSFFNLFILGVFNIKLFTMFQSFSRTVYNFFFTVTISGHPYPAKENQLSKLKRDCVVNYFGVTSIYISALVPLLFYMCFFASKEN